MIGPIKITVMKKLGLLVMVMLNIMIATAQVNNIETDQQNNDTDNYLDVTLYPNPSRGYFSVKMENDEPYDIAIYAMNGMLVFSQQNVQENNLKLDMASSIAKGFYHVRINQGENAIVKKLIIQ